MKRYNLLIEATKYIYSKEELNHVMELETDQIATFVKRMEAIKNTKAN